MGGAANAIRSAPVHLLARAIEAELRPYNLGRLNPLGLNLAAPALVVAGAEDTLIPPAASEEMSKAIRNATLAIVPRAGHLPNLEQETQFDTVLAQFLKQF